LRAVIVRVLELRAKVRGGQKDVKDLDSKRTSFTFTTSRRSR